MDDKEKLEAIKKVFGELEMDFDSIHDHEDIDHDQVGYDIKEILEK